MSDVGGGRRDEGPADRTRVLLYVVGAILAVVVVAFAAILALRGGDNHGATGTPATTPSVTSTTSVTTTSATSQTTTARTTSPTTSPATLAPEEAASVVWPEPGGGTVYRDPIEAAVSMATELVGFTSPVVGEFQQGDSRSGEVPIRPTRQGPISTVLVRQLSDGHWYVLGASSDDLRLESPNAGSQVSSPMTVSGQSRAFEGTILVSVLARGDTEPLARKPLQGGSNADLGPFSGTVRFDAPSGGGAGVVMLTTDSAKDGSIRQATVVPVVLAGP